MSIFQQAISAIDAEKRAQAIAEMQAAALREQERASFTARAQGGIERICAILVPEVQAIESIGGAAAVKQQIFAAHYVVSFDFSFVQKRFKTDNIPVFEFTVRVDRDTQVSIHADGKMTASAHGFQTIALFEPLDLQAPSFERDLSAALVTAFKSAVDFAERNS